MVVTASGLKARARELGFDLCGIAPAEEFPELTFLDEWLRRGHAGTMAYLARTAARRRDARHVLPTARSVIVTGTVYHTARPLSTEIADRSVALVSRYAWGADYHEVVGRRLEALVEWMRAQSSTPLDARTCVDTGPVQERIYAQHAGLGWIGKNTCLINGDLGSWVFLGEVLCSLPLEPDPPVPDRCGTCSLCIESCPTGAIVGPHVLDATRCLAYLTIELKGRIPESLRRSLGAHVFGCDLCQEVCPWNAGAPVSAAAEWQPRPGLDQPRLADLWQSDDAGLGRLIAGTPLTRPGLRGLRRNLAVAIGNSGDPVAAAGLATDSLPEGTGDRGTARDPLVRDHIEWAVNQAGSAPRAPATRSR